MTSVRSGAWARREQQTLRARGVVVAAGALGTNRLLAALQAERLAAEGLGPARLPRAHQQRVDHGRDRAEGLPRRLHASRSRSPRASTPTRTRTSRSSPTAAARDSQSWLFRRCWSRPAERGTQPLQFLASAARHPRELLKAVAVQGLLAPHDHPARHAVDRELDAPEGQAPPPGRRRGADDRAGPRAPQPGRAARSPTTPRGGSPSGPAGSRNRHHRGAVRDPLDGAHPRRRRDRRRARDRA